METQEEIQFIRNCFCERLNILQLAFGWQQKYQDRCEEYIGKVNNYYYSLPAYGLVVSIVNWALKMTVKNGSRWLKFKDITTEAKFQMTFLYALQLINMSLPLAVMNLDFSHEEWIYDIQ